MNKANGEEFLNIFLSTDLNPDLKKKLLTKKMLRNLAVLA